MGTMRPARASSCRCVCTFDWLSLRALDRSTDDASSPFSRASSTAFLKTLSCISDLETGVFVTPSLAKLAEMISSRVRSACLMMSLSAMGHSSSIRT